MRSLWLSIALASLVGCGRNATNIDTGATDPKVSAEAKSPAAKPTTFGTRELAKTLDLTALPQIDGTEFTQKTPAHVTGTAIGKVQETLEFYRVKMAALGWETVPVPGVKIGDEHGSLRFVKDGHIANLHAGKGYRRKDDPPKTSFNFVFHGNFDARTLPLRDAKFEDHSDPISAVYTSKNGVADEGAWATKALLDAGWHEYRAFGMKDRGPEKHVLRSFRKQGYALQLYVSKYTSEGDTKILYRTHVLPYDVPAPPNAANVEYDEEQFKLRCEAPGDLKATGEFYRTAMAAAGYKALPSDEPKGESWFLGFETEDGRRVLVRLLTAKENATIVSIAADPAVQKGKKK